MWLPGSAPRAPKHRSSQPGQEALSRRRQSSSREPEEPPGKMRCVQRLGGSTKDGRLGVTAEAAQDQREELEGPGSSAWLENSAPGGRGCLLRAGLPELAAFGGPGLTWVSGASQGTLRVEEEAGPAVSHSQQVSQGEWSPSGSVETPQLSPGPCWEEAAASTGSSILGEPEGLQGRGLASATDPRGRALLQAPTTCSSTPGAPSQCGWPSSLVLLLPLQPPTGADPLLGLCHPPVLSSCSV